MRIVGIAGSAKAGKTSAANYIVGHSMVESGAIDRFELDDKGRLLIEADVIQESGAILRDMVPFSCKNTERDPEFEVWARDHLWPNTKIYSLADPLKYWLIDTFGLTYEQCFGSDKYSNTNITWEQVAFLPLPEGLREKTGLMVAREVMEVFGTCFTRQVNEKAYITAALLRVKHDQPQLAIIDDVRADFEAELIQEAGGIIVQLTRGLEKNLSEKTVDNIKPDILIDNKKMTMDETHLALIKELYGT
jgi:hypothetical protein